MAEGLTFGMNITAHIKQNRPAEILQALEKSIDYGARLVRTRAREIVPVDTGRLRKSIAIRDIPDGKGIGPDTDYDIYVEFGTERMAKQPYMRPALDENAKKISMFLQKKVRQALS